MLNPKKISAISYDKSIWLLYCYLKFSLQAAWRCLPNTSRWKAKTIQCVDDLVKSIRQPMAVVENPCLLFVLFFLPWNKKGSSAMRFTDQPLGRAAIMAAPAGHKGASSSSFFHRPLLFRHCMTVYKHILKKIQCPHPVKLLVESLITGHGQESRRVPICRQKCATTFISRPPAPPEPAPEPWAWFSAWPTAMWWRPELKLAHSRLTGSLGDRETSGPAPSRDNVAKQADGQRVKGE